MNIYLIILLVIIVSIIALLYLPTLAEKRTNYPTWSESTTTNKVGNKPLWQPDSEGSDKKPEYLKFIDTEFIDANRTQRELTVAWIENKVNAGGPDSQTSQGPSGISSILVKDINGNEKELPIMDFFEKIHGDLYLGWLRSKDYTDELVGNLHINLANQIDASKKEILAYIVPEIQRLDRDKVTSGVAYHMKFPVVNRSIQVLREYGMDNHRWLSADSGGYGDEIIIYQP